MHLLQLSCSRFYLPYASLIAHLFFPTEASFRHTHIEFSSFPYTCWLYSTLTHSTSLNTDWQHPNLFVCFTFTFTPCFTMMNTTDWTLLAPPTGWFQRARVTHSRCDPDHADPRGHTRWNAGGCTRPAVGVTQRRAPSHLTEKLRTILEFPNRQLLDRVLDGVFFALLLTQTCIPVLSCQQSSKLTFLSPTNQVNRRTARNITVVSPKWTNLRRRPVLVPLGCGSKEASDTRIRVPSPAHKRSAE